MLSSLYRVFVLLMLGLASRDWFLNISLWVSLKNASTSSLGLVSLLDFASPSSVLVNRRGLWWTEIFCFHYPSSSSEYLLLFGVCIGAPEVDLSVPWCVPFHFSPELMDFPLSSAWLMCRLDFDFSPEIQNALLPDCRLLLVTFCLAVPAGGQVLV